MVRSCFCRDICLLLHIITIITTPINATTKTITMMTTKLNDCFLLPANIVKGKVQQLIHRSRKVVFCIFRSREIVFAFNSPEKYYFAFLGLER